MKKDFYSRARELDLLKQATQYSLDMIAGLLIKLRDISLYRYFFFNLENPIWIQDRKFKRFLSERLSSGLKYEPYRVAEYLSVIAPKDSLNVYRVVRDSSPTEYHTLRITLDTINKLDPLHASKLVTLVQNSLTKKGFLEHELLGKLVNRLATGGYHKQSLQLFQSITKPIKREFDRTSKTLPFSQIHVEAESILDPHELKGFMKIAVPTLLDKSPLQLAGILEKQLKESFRIEQVAKQRNYVEDFSWIWRPAIEEHEQNFEFGNLKEVLAVSLRDTLEALAKTDHVTIKGTIERLLRSRYSLFRRLALHIIRIHFDGFRESAEEFISNRKNFEDHRVTHEFFKLLKEHFAELSKETTDQLMRWIDRGPDRGVYIRWFKRERGIIPEKDQVQRYVDEWRLERLWPLREQLPDRREEIEELSQKTGVPKHPDSSSWHGVSFGFESPLTIEQLKSESDEGILAHLRSPKPSARDPESPFEGLARTFGFLVQENVGRFTRLANGLADEGIRPIFVQSYFRALEEAWKKGTETTTAEVLALATYVVDLNKNTFKLGTDNTKRADGTYNGARSALASYIETIMRNRNRPVLDEGFRRYRDLLLTMVGDSDPSAADERQYGPPNVDWATVSVNSTAGKILHALIHYALRYAHENKGTVPRLEIEVREKFTEVLRDDRRFSVRAVFGMYFANFCYLDFSWVKENLSLFFPEKDQKHWMAVWKAYIAYNDLYKNVYTLLKKHYLNALERLEDTKETSAVAGHLAEHVALVYWRGWEEIEVQGSIVNEFYRTASSRLRVSIVEHFRQGLKTSAETGQLMPDKDVWQRPRRLWEWRLSVAKNSSRRETFSAEISAFLGWLESAPEDVQSLYNLIRASLEFVVEHFRSGDVTGYLAKHSDKYPSECVELLDTFLQNATKEYFHYDRTETRTILEHALGADSQTRLIARNIANMLGERGDFRFKDIWEKSKEPMPADVL